MLELCDVVRQTAFEGLRGAKIVARVPIIFQSQEDPHQQQERRCQMGDGEDPLFTVDLVLRHCCSPSVVIDLSPLDRPLLHSPAPR